MGVIAHERNMYTCNLFRQNAAAGLNCIGGEVELLEQVY